MLQKTRYVNVQQMANLTISRGLNITFLKLENIWKQLPLIINQNNIQMYIFKKYSNYYIGKN